MSIFRTASFPILAIFLLHGLCQAQLAIRSSIEKDAKLDSIVLDLRFSDPVKYFVSDSSKALSKAQPQQTNYLVRLGICAASAIFFKPGGTPALCNIVPPVKRW